MKRSSIKNNALWIIGCRVVQLMLGMVISMLSARYLGPSNFGLINYAASVVSFFVPIMQLGLRGILVKEIIDTPDEEGETVGTALVLNCASAVMCMIAIFFFVSFVNADETTTIIVCLLYSINLIFQAIEIIQYWFQAKLLSKYTSIVSLIAYIIVSLYKIYLLVTEKGIYWFAIAQAFDYGIIAVLLLILCKRKIGQKLFFSWNKAKNMYSRSKYYIISDMMVTIFQQTDKLMLKNMVDDASVGLYSAAVTCAGLTTFVFSAIIDSFRPVILEKKKYSDKEYKTNLSILFSIVFYMSLIQCIVMTLFAQPIVKILYGAKYIDASNVLMIIVWYVTYSHFGSVRNIWILSEGKQRYLWIINLLGALTNVVLNACLIPICGIKGAAYASFITQFFTNFILGFIMKPLKECNRFMLKGMNPKFAYKAIKKYA